MEKIGAHESEYGVTATYTSLAVLQKEVTHGSVHGSEHQSLVFQLHTFSSAGRASALQAEGHRFKSCKVYSNLETLLGSS